MGVEERRQAFGARLREARTAKGLALRELAPLAGISYGVLGRMERGLHGTGEDTVVLLEDALGLDRHELGWLLGYGPAPDTAAPEEAIKADRLLSDHQKEVLLAALAVMRQQAADPTENEGG